MKEVNKDLIRILEKEIFPLYEHNDIGHNLDHIKYVIERSLMFAKSVSDINVDMVYAIAAFHDVGVYIDRDNHEKVSAEIMTKTEWLKNFFTGEEIVTMAEAVEDHRASLEYEPRSIYGKIVSSADRNVSIDLPLVRTFTFRMKLKPGSPMEEILEESRKHLINKFGTNGYASEKMYFDDEEYKIFLENIASLVNDKE
ncbi:MAG: HD domain-containing protein, partial [Bacilli bacterium]|nr:HD domain-containing protein [Bacilli bacterium]